MFALNKLLRPLLSNVFIALNIDNGSCFVRILRQRESCVLEEVDREFRIFDERLPVEVVKFIKSYKRCHPFSYIGLIAKSPMQGVIDMANQDPFTSVELSSKECKILPIKDWGVYIRKCEIVDIQKHFARLGGVDYIFSPFVVMYHTLQEALDSKLRLYVLLERSQVALMVANEGGAYFGGVFAITHQTESGTPQGLSELGDLGLDDEMHALEGLENLGLGGGIEEELDEEVQMEDVSQIIEDITNASALSDIIHGALGEFYANDSYEEGFVEEIVFLDNIGVSQDILSYIHEAVLLDVQRRSFCVQEALLQMMQQEFVRK